MSNQYSLTSSVTYRISPSAVQREYSVKSYFIKKAINRYDQKISKVKSDKDNLNRSILNNAEGKDKLLNEIKSRGILVTNCCPFEEVIDEGRGPFYVPASSLKYYEDRLIDVRQNNKTPYYMKASEEWLKALKEKTPIIYIPRGKGDIASISHELGHHINYYEDDRSLVDVILSHYSKNSRERANKFEGKKNLSTKEIIIKAYDFGFIYLDEIRASRNGRKVLKKLNIPRNIRKEVKKSNSLAGKTYRFENKKEICKNLLEKRNGDN